MARAPRRRRTTLERETVQARDAVSPPEWRRDGRDGGGLRCRGFQQSPVARSFPDLARGILTRGPAGVARVDSNDIRAARQLCGPRSVAARGEMWTREVLLAERASALEDDLCCRSPTSITLPSPRVMSSSSRPSSAVCLSPRGGAAWRETSTSARRPFEAWALMRQKRHHDVPATGVLASPDAGGADLGGAQAGVTVIAGADLEAWATSPRLAPAGRPPRPAGHIPADTSRILDPDRGTFVRPRLSDSSGAPGPTTSRLHCRACISPLSTRRGKARTGQPAA